MAESSEFNVGRKAILLEIRGLHQQREPLNISAVKRHHPKLIASVYEIKPYWGWRQALADAGVLYEDINVELLDYCTCRICGNDYGTLSSHLHHRHEMHLKDYRARFPGAEVVSETTRAKIMRPQQHLPHWEPLWSWEYVLDRAMEYRRWGWQLDADAVTQRERVLYSFVLWYGCDWDDVLRAIDLDPDEIRLVDRKRSLSKVDVIAALKRRLRQKKGLSSACLLKEDQRLLNAAIRRFGGHRQALKAAGIDPEKVQVIRSCFRDEDHQTFEALVRHIATLPRRERREAQRQLHRDWESIIYQHYGNLEKACQRFGVPFAHLNLRVPYVNALEVIEEIRSLFAKGHKSNWIQIHAGVYLWARRYCGSWAAAVAAARAC